MTTPAQHGITQSHKRIVRFARQKNYPSVFVAENDFYIPAKDGLDWFFRSYEDYGYSSDMHLGGIYVGKDYLSADNKIVKQFSGLHFYIVNQKFYDRFLEADDTQSLDNALSAMARTNEAKITCCFPMAVIQHENISSTSGCVFKHDKLFNSKNVYGFTEDKDAWV